MKKKILSVLFSIFIILINFILIISCHPKFLYNKNEDIEFHWTKLRGSIYEENCQSTCKDNIGNIYILGNSNSSFDGQTNYGSYDFFIIKYDSKGNHIWTRFKGGSEIDYAYDIVYDPNGFLYVVGYTSGSFDGQTNNGSDDIFVVKYDLNGNTIWTRLIGTNSNDQGRAICIDKSGYIYITGSSWGNFYGANNGQNDTFILKLDPGGNVLWGVLRGSNNYENGMDIITDNDNNIYLCGNTNGSFDSQINNGGEDIFVIKYSSINSSPIHEWTIFKGSSIDDYVTKIFLDSNNKIYIVGTTFGNIDSQLNMGGGDGFIIKLNNINGNTIFTKLKGGPLQEDGYFSIFIKEYFIYAIGYTNSSFDSQINNGGEDILLVKYDINGNHIWTKFIGTEQNETGVDILIDNFGAIIMVGNAAGPLNNQLNFGESDVFIIKLLSK